MTNLTDRLSEALKIVLGRKLTLKQIEEARANGTSHPDLWDYLSHEEDKIVRRQTYFENATTPDHSHPHIMHTGLYPVERIDSEYTPDGLLTKREVSTNLPASYQTSYKEVVYNPAGRIIGRGLKIT